MIGSSRGMPPILAFLFDLAWASRVRLPLLVAVAFMVTNLHMRLEINVNFENEDQIVVHADDAADTSSNEDEESLEDETVLLEGNLVNNTGEETDGNKSGEVIEETEWFDMDEEYPLNPVLEGSRLVLEECAKI